MRYVKLVALLLSVSLALYVVPSIAQQAPPPPPPYGAPLSLDQAKKAMAGAEAEAKKNNWNVVIAIVDSGGHLVMLQRLDSTQIGSIDVAKDKATTAVHFRRPTKAFQDLIAQGGVNLRLLKITNASPLEGGVPIIVGGAIVGGVGVSGVTSAQDAQIAQAGADAVLK